MAAIDQRMSLLRSIQELEFTALELNLYLDTHPDDPQALEYFNRTSEELANLKMQYEQQYGPLLSYGFGKNAANAKAWSWAESPWPWEM